MKIPLLVIVLMFLLPLSLAEITFDPVKSSYSPGPATFSFTVTNDLNVPADIEVSAVVFPEENPTYLDTPLYYWNDTLAPGTLKKYEIPLTISETSEAGVHIVSVTVDGDIIESSPQQFSVVGTKVPLSINAVACSGDCSSYTTAFLLSESPLTIKVLHSEEANIIGDVTTPLGNQKILSFTNAQATLAIDEEGIYTIEVNAKKEGYTDDSDTLEIVTMKELPEVIYDTPCNANGECDGAETRQNCPMDCLPDEVGPYAGEDAVAAAQEEHTNTSGPALDSQKEEKNAGGIDWTLFIIILVILIIIFLLWDSRTKK